jgi:hypothetical protein
LIEKRTMGWLPKASTYDYQQSLNAKRKAIAQAALSSTSALASGVFSVSTSVAQGMSEIAANAAMARIKKSA